MQPWGPHKGRQATLLSEHHTAAAAFAAIDQLSAEMVRTGAPSDAIELVVVDATDQIVPRPDTHWPTRSRRLPSAQEPAGPNPACGRGYRLVEQRRWQCAACRYQVSLTAGTILHNTKTPLAVWFWAAYLTVTDKRGISALLLQRQMGRRRYETAWLLLHKLRRAMVNVGREPLHGDVEIDDTWVGAPQAGLRGSRQLKGRKAAIVLVAVERRGDRSGRVRMSVIPDFKQTTMLAFVMQHVAPGSTVYSDGLKSSTVSRPPTSSTSPERNRSGAPCTGGALRGALG